MNLYTKTILAPAAFSMKVKRHGHKFHGNISNVGPPLKSVGLCPPKLVFETIFLEKIMIFYFMKRQIFRDAPGQTFSMT